MTALHEPMHSLLRDPLETKTFIEALGWVVDSGVQANGLAGGGGLVEKIPKQSAADALIAAIGSQTDIDYPQFL